MALLGRERKPFLGLALAAMVGITVANFSPSISVLSLLGAAGACLFALYWRRTPLVLGLVAAVFFCLHSSRLLRTPADRLADFAGSEVRPVSVTGIVTTEPKLDPKGVATFLFQLRKAQLGSTVLVNNATIYAHWRGASHVGDELALFGTLQPIEPPRNPGEFNMRAHLARKGVTRSLIVRYPENGQTVRSGTFSLLRAAAHSRDWMQRTLSRGIEDSPDVISLICGTSLGLRHQTRDDIEEPFQQTGTLHLFAVAGLHVGIVAWLLWTVANVLRLPRKLATACIIPLLFFYAAVTGLHTASIRAAIMSALLMGGIFVERRVFALNSLAAAAFLILLWDSNELFTSGFQLSFSVVAAIILLADPLYRWLRRIGEPDPFLPRAIFGWFRRWQLAISNALARGVSVSAAAWVGSLPCVYAYYNLVTPISLLANVAVVPVAYFVLALALLSLLSAPLSAALSLLFNNANWLLARIILALVHYFAAIPGGHFYLPDLGTRRAPVSMAILDEGTGAATHITANGYHWLIDCGSARTYERTLKPYLRSRGVNRLEGVVLTHGDAQHIGAAAFVLEDFAPREVYDNPLAVRSIVQRELLRRGHVHQHLARGDTLLLGRDVHAETLYPPPKLRITSADDAPVIVRVTIADETSVLFESDAGFEAETALLDHAAELRSDILVKGQHHEGGSGRPEFLDAVAPKLIIATSRESPVAEKIPQQWADEIARRGIKLFRQDETGGVEIECGRDGWSARSYLTGELFRSSKR